MKLNVTILFICLFTLTGCLSKKHIQEEALALTNQHFKDTMVIKDDDFEASVTFSTQRGYDEMRTSAGMLLRGLGGTLPDCFLRGFIHKQTGLKTIQCYVAYRHQNGGWAYPYQVNYGRPLHTEDVTKISSDVDCHHKLNGSCTYEEHIVFTITDEELLRIKEAPEEVLNTKVWGFRLKNKNGTDYDGVILLREFIALMEVMETYQPVEMR